MERSHDLILFAMASGLVGWFGYLGQMETAEKMGMVVVGAIVMYLKGK